LPGESLRISHIVEEPEEDEDEDEDDEDEPAGMPLFFLPLREGAAGHFDYLLRNDADEIDFFGRIAFNARHTMEPGYYGILTNTGALPSVLVIPQAFLEAGLVVEAWEQAAFFRQTLQEGEILSITNKDPLYNRSLRLENVTNARGSAIPIVYDYIIHDARGSLIRYGESRGLDVNIPAGAVITLMPRPGSALSMAMPFEWYEPYFESAREDEPPLFRIVLRPGERLIIHNTFRDRTFRLSNNSAASPAGYVFRPVSGVFQPDEDEQPSQGTILVEESAHFIIQATIGADLELWMPVAVARALRFF
jgi:hypothetical protein